MESKQLLESLTGVDRAKVGDNGFSDYVELTIDHQVIDMVRDMFGQWDEAFCEDAGIHTRIRFTQSHHEVESACIVAPYEVDIESGQAIGDIELGEEATSQGYFRRFEWAECKCGEKFNDYQELQNHL